MSITITFDSFTADDAIALASSKGPLPEVEHIIAQSAPHSYEYAKMIGQRFELGEPAILKEAACAFFYAKDVIKGRWPEAEPLLLTDATTALNYALLIIRGRWPEFEQLILGIGDASVASIANKYAAYGISGRWPEAEALIAMNELVWANYLYYFADEFDNKPAD